MRRELGQRPQIVGWGVLALVIGLVAAAGGVDLRYSDEVAPHSYSARVWTEGVAFPADSNRPSMGQVRRWHDSIPGGAMDSSLYQTGWGLILTWDHDTATFEVDGGAVGLWGDLRWLGINGTAESTAAVPDSLSVTALDAGRIYGARESLTGTTTYNDLNSTLSVKASSGLGTPYVKPAGGRQDATWGGTYVGIYASETCFVWMYKPGTVDSFKFKYRRSNSWSAAVGITGAAQALTTPANGSGVTIAFAATTGHTANDTFCIPVSQSPALTIYDAPGNVIGQVNQQNIRLGSGATTISYGGVAIGMNANAAYTGLSIGGLNNTAASGNGGSAVVGGTSNTANGMNAFVGGGSVNTSSGDYSSVIGGKGNRALGVYSYSSGYLDSAGITVNDSCATVVGGYGNTVAGGRYSVIAGGKGNRETGSYASIAGGLDNRGSGNYSFVGGGTADTASGVASATLGGIGCNASDSGAVTLGGQNGIAAKWQSVAHNAANTQALVGDTVRATQGLVVAAGKPCIGLDSMPKEGAADTLLLFLGGHTYKLPRAQE